jgi:hypothetical protein
LRYLGATAPNSGARGLKVAGTVNSHCALKTLIDDHNFPMGRWLGSATLNEVEQWLANRPVERPVPNASDKGRR